MRVNFRRVDWPFASTFRIAYSVETVANAVWVELTDGEHMGRGEALGVSYHDESVNSMLAQLEAVKGALEKGISCEQLQKLLPPGGARNAVDCALWDLEAKRSGRRVWELLGLQPPAPLVTAYTLSMDSPIAMAEAASALRGYSLLKLKLGGDDDVERVKAVRHARPDVALIVDANESWSQRHLREFTPQLAELGVRLIEQPLPAGQDELLLGFTSAVPLCADESCQTVESLPALLGKYQYLNIKLDKTGGLTEALRLAHRAKESGFALMVGCMAGSSLSMAPAFIVGQLCSVVDLDGPLLATADVPNAMRYQGSFAHVPEAALWG
jgi:L-alanine-DL-glutamate epimerase-like enolase superfamily enzyme